MTRPLRALGASIRPDPLLDPEHLADLVRRLADMLGRELAGLGNEGDAGARAVRIRGLDVLVRALDRSHALARKAGADASAGGPSDDDLRTDLERKLARLAAARRETPHPREPESG